MNIKVVADVHLGARECMEQEFMRFLENVKNTPNTYLVLGGDLIDNGTKSSVTNCFEARYRPSEQKKMMAKLLEPVADRILAGVPGNHEARSGKDADDDPLYDIMAKLDIEHLYRQNIAFIRIRMGDNHKSEGRRNPSYNLALVHGSGGGIYTGGAINKNERFSYILEGIDALLVGHSHKPASTTPARISVNHKGEIAVKEMEVICASSWLQYGGYAARGMLLPAGHADQTLTLCGKKKQIIYTKEPLS